MEVAAARGNQKAVAALEGPEMPDAVTYLARWIYELHGRSGLGQAGVAPLSYTTIEAWARLKGITVEPWECEALVMLDAVLAHPEADED